MAGETGMGCEHGEWYVEQGNMVCGRGCERRASDIIADLTRILADTTGELDRLTWLLHSVSRTHGLGDHVKKRIRQEVWRPDPGDGWSPYQLQQDVKRLEGQVEHKDEALRAAVAQMGEFQGKYHRAALAIRRARILLERGADEPAIADDPIGTAQSVKEASAILKKALDA